MQFNSTESEAFKTESVEAEETPEGNIDPSVEDVFIDASFSTCKCEFCGLDCKNEYHLKKHIDQVCEDARKKRDLKICKCVFCGESFPNQNRLRLHIKKSCKSATRYFEERKLERFKYKCDLCQEVFDKRDKLRLHVKVCDASCTSKRLACDDCGDICDNKTLLKDHQKTCQVFQKKRLEKHKCDFCSKCYPAKKELEVHVKTECPGTAEKRELEEYEKQRDCVFCNTVFPNERQLRLHMQLYCQVRKVNEELKQRKCRYCEAVHKNPHQTKIHEKRDCTKAPRKCTKCYYTCENGGALADHLVFCLREPLPTVKACVCGVPVKIDQENNFDRKALVDHSDTCRAFPELSLAALKGGFIEPVYWKRAEGKRRIFAKVFFKNDSIMYPVLKNRSENWRIYESKKPFFDRESLLFKHAFEADVADFKEFPPYILYFPRMRDLLRKGQLVLLMGEFFNNEKAFNDARERVDYGDLQVDDDDPEFDPIWIDDGRQDTHRNVFKTIIPDKLKKRFEELAYVRKLVHANKYTDCKDDCKKIKECLATFPNWIAIIRSGMEDTKRYLSMMYDRRPEDMTAPMPKPVEYTPDHLLSKAALKWRKRLAKISLGGKPPRRPRVPWTWEYMRPNTGDSRKMFSKIVRCKMDEVDVWIDKVFGSAKPKIDTVVDAVVRDLNEITV